MCVLVCVACVCCLLCISWKRGGDSGLQNLGEVNGDLLVGWRGPSIPV